MRIRPFLCISHTVLTSLCVSCLPLTQKSDLPTHPNQARPNGGEPSSQITQAIDPSPSPNALPISAPRVTRKTLSGIQFEGVSFDARSHQLQVIDQANGPGSEFHSAKDVALKSQAFMAINAGFFTPEGKALGLVISDGKQAGSWNSQSSLGSGIYQIDPSGHASLSRRISKRSTAFKNSKELLQAGPLLIENSQTVQGLESQKIARRSILLHDGRSCWWIGITSPCSLAQLGQSLFRNSPTSWKISIAMNLDGGRSTDLFISSKLSDGPMERRSLINRPVRNFLVLKPR